MASERHAGTASVCAYYQAVWRRAGNDAWRLVGTHLWFAALVLAVTYGIGVLLGTRLDGETLTGYLLLPLAALGCVALGVFVVALIRAPVVLDRDASHIADTRLRAANEQLEAANDRLAAAEAEPVSPDHQRELQEIAETLLSGIRVLQLAFFVSSSVPSTNLAYGFREHFPDEAADVDGWNLSVRELDAKRAALRTWVEAKVAELRTRLDLPLGGSVAAGIADIAERDEQHLVLAAVAGHLQMGDHPVVTADGTDRVNVERSLRGLLSEATVSNECTLVVNARHDLEAVRGPLVERLSIISERDKISKGNGCRLCR